MLFALVFIAIWIEEWDKIVSFIFLLGASIIWVSDITESISKVSTYCQEIYRRVINDKPELLADLVAEIQNQKGKTKNFSDAYRKLRNLILLNGEDDDFINKISRFTEPLYAKSIGQISFISTTNQYNMDGLVLFFNTKTGEILLKDNELSLGISGVKVITRPNVSPSKLIVVKYITITGTGTFGHSVKFYTFDDGLVLTSLDKPYSEVNSGWDAFETDTVEFKTRNDVVVKNGVMEIHTVGVALVYGEKLEYRDLPEEIYIWKTNSRSFEQIKGRLTHKQGLMTNIYSDIADAKGNWFQKPMVLESGSVNDVFEEEQW